MRANYFTLADKSAQGVYKGVVIALTFLSPLARHYTTSAHCILSRALSAKVKNRNIAYSPCNFNRTSTERIYGI